MYRRDRESGDAALRPKGKASPLLSIGNDDTGIRTMSAFGGLSSNEQSNRLVSEAGSFRVALSKKGFGLLRARSDGSVNADVLQDRQCRVGVSVTFQQDGRALVSESSSAANPDERLVESGQSN